MKLYGQIATYSECRVGKNDTKKLRLEKLYISLPQNNKANVLNRK